MKLSKDWNDFRTMIDKIYPKYGETMMPLPFDDDMRDDLGTDR